MRKLFIILAAIIPIEIFAQSNDVRPFLVALQVDNLDRSVAWYRDMLGFSLTDKKDFPDYGLKIGMMKSGDFQLELVENNKTTNKADALKTLKVDEITGFAKVAFRIADVAAKYKDLQSKHADFKVVLSDSNINPSEKFFIVADPDGNWVQFVGAK